MTWRYDGIYSFYNAVDAGANEDLEEMLDGSHYAASDGHGRLVGFFAVGASCQVPGGQRAGAYGAEALDVGLGLRPDLTGTGLGLRFAQEGLDFLADRLNPGAFRLSVATFNRRAILVYERAGFVAGPRFMSDTPAGEAEFLLMTRIYASVRRSDSRPPR